MVTSTRDIIILDQDIYCGVCLKIVTAPERPSLITDTTIIMGSGDPDLKDSCPRCGGKVNHKSVSSMSVT